MNNRQIDALVAEHVFGSVLAFMSEYDTYPAILIDQATAHFDEIPEYSTDIAAAWSVVDRMPHDPRPEEDRFHESDGFTLARLQGCQWFAGWLEIIPYEGSHELYEYSVTADTAPMAICLAALRSVGVEVGE